MYSPQHIPQQKPEAPLIGLDGNIFCLLGAASQVLKRNRMNDSSKELIDRVMYKQEADSYEKALMIIQEYVEIV